MSPRRRGTRVRAKPARAKAQGVQRPHTDKAGRKSPADVGRLLDSLADAISLIAKAASAIEYAQALLAKSKWADQARYLVFGLQYLRRVRSDIAVALHGVRP